MAFEESADQIVANAATLGWDIPGLAARKLFFLDASLSPEMIQAGQFDLTRLLNVLQAISRTLKESVTFDAAGVTALDWAAYPILTFPEVPDAVDIVLIERRDTPPLGAGEPATCPIPAAIANAVFDATGVRLRTVPFTPARVREELARP